MWMALRDRVRGRRRRSAPGRRRHRQAVDGQKLLILFGLLMIVDRALMLRKRAGGGDPVNPPDPRDRAALLPRLIGIGFGVGLLAGFFGIGGGFLIVPGLILATGMPLTSRSARRWSRWCAFGASTAANYACPD